MKNISKQWLMEEYGLNDDGATLYLAYLDGKAERSEIRNISNDVKDYDRGLYPRQAINEGKRYANTYVGAKFTIGDLVRDWGKLYAVIHVMKGRITLRELN